MTFHLSNARVVGSLVCSEIAGFQIKISRERNQNFIVYYCCQQRMMLSDFMCLSWAGALSVLFVWALARVSLWSQCLDEPSSCSHLSFPGYESLLCFGAS